MVKISQEPVFDCAGLKNNPACPCRLLSLKCVTCVVRVGQRGYFGVREARGRMGLVEMRLLILSMGLVSYIEVLIPAQRATTTSKRFSLVITKHILNTVECAVKMLVQIIYFLFCTLKINHVMGVTKYMHLFLDPVAWLQTFVSFYDDMSPFLFKSISML